ncbi:hypothetical protein FB45DRAFT_33055 [Roridomyces roridus]|uniref:Uncharacterized protein n=1 Tax=Roridomyces roridus TaxID=1738132 RepID=A0AAD7CLF5_9AGAR|nr:hypothetical protein FB45DRAFT_33055 [Roridomyces roridus]
MSAPTQQLPPWLSLTTITAAQTTETSLVYLPLTFFGNPSIPLGTLWTYGGLSSPAPTSSAAVTSTGSSTPSTSSTTISTTSATSLSSATPSATPSTITSTPTVSSSTATGSSSASASSSSVPTVAISSSALTRGQLIGVVVGSILGFLVLFLFLLCCCLRYREGRRGGDSRSSTKFTLLPRRRRGRTRFTMVTPPVGGQMEEIDDWLVVASPTSPREPGRGATEADPFLASADAGPSTQLLPNPHSTNNSNSASSRETASTSASSGTNASGYGVLLDHPTLRFPPPPEGNPFAALPPGAAQPQTPADNANLALSGRRILSPAQMATLVEEDDTNMVLPRPSVDGGLSHISEGSEGEVLVASRVPVSSLGSLSVPTPSSSRETRRSWIPRFSWLRDSRNSREMDIEEEGGLLLFDSGRGHSPSNSISSPSPALLDAPRLTSPPDSPPPTSPAPVTGEMREFGARPLLPFLARPPSSAHPDSRPISGVSSDGTTGSAKSGGTVYTDAKETLSSQASRSSARLGNRANTSQSNVPDPLDLPAPAPLAAFASSSQHSLHHVPSSTSVQDSSNGTERQTATLAGSASNTTLATTPATGNSLLQPERAYAYSHPPPGLGSFASYSASASSKGTGGWDPAALELGFSRPASHDKLGTFGSGNVIPGPGPTTSSFGGAPGIRIVGAPTTIASAGPAADGQGGAVAPHLSLDLDDAPPGAEGGWRLIGGSQFGSQTSLGSGHGAGRRGTFGGAGSGAAEYHFASGPPSEHGSFHSRIGSSSLNSASLSSGSRSGHAQMASGATGNSSYPAGHSLYPSSDSGGSNKSARARAMLHAASVEGPMSPATSAFGHRVREAGDHSGSSGSGHSERRRQENSSLSPPMSPLMAPWVGGLAPEWRPT